MSKKIKPSIVALFVLIATVLILTVYAFVWLFYSKNTFDKYTDCVPKYADLGYIGVDEQGYSYHVKTPTFPSFDGNLSISPPLGNQFVASGLIIWVGAKNELCYGVLLEHEKETYQIVIDKNGNTVKQPNMYDETYALYKTIVDLNSDFIYALLSKADACWGVTNGNKTDLNLKSIE
ncbi:MAG: hypothetical protein RR764_04340 [Oscillospiraceae bacterium]